MDKNIKNIIGSLVAVGFSGTEYNKHIKKMIREYHVSNVILFARNVSTLSKLVKLTKRIHKEIIEYTGETPLIMIDQEGGVVTRIFEEATFLPGAMTIGASHADSYRIGKIMGEELIRLGIDMNLAPVLDVNTNPLNPVIGIRSFSDNLETVKNLANEEIKGIQEAGVIAVGKHFPGHGDTKVDSHLGLPVVNKSLSKLQKEELFPFREAITSGVKAIMTAHILFPEVDMVPATISKVFLKDVLREELGFKGLVISDSMEMKAIANEYTTPKAVGMGILAGLDIAMVSHSEDLQIASIEELMRLYHDNEKLFLDTYRHVKEIKETTASYLKPFYEEPFKGFENGESQKFSQEVVDGSLTLVSGKPFLRGKNTLAIIPKVRVQTIAEDKFREVDLFTLIRHSHLGITPLRIEVNEINKDVITKHICKYDNIIFFSYNAYLNEKQSQLINLINYYHKEVYVISLRGPYDLVKLQNISNFMTLFEYTPNAVRTLMKFLSGGLKPLGKLPVNVKKGFKTGASVYVGLEEYPLKDNLKYLELLSSVGIEEVFISGHMPEANENFTKELTEVINKASELNLKVVLDISKPSFSKLPNIDKIFALRLDWGFTIEDVLELSKKYAFLIELNASSVRESELMFLLSQGVPQEKLRVSHNFYPKPYTGLSHEEVLRKNEMFHRHGFEVMAYISAEDKRRKPLKEGLPTIESHRHANIYEALLDMKYLMMDRVYFGDSYASKEELEILKSYSTLFPVVPVIFSGKDMTGVYSLRIDQGEYELRISKTREENVEPFNTVKRDRKSLTCDNKLFLRYSGEMAIILKDLPSDSRVNVIGKVLCSDFSLNYLQDEQKIILKGVKK